MKNLFQTFRNQLGVNARLGVSACLVDPNGNRRSEIGFGEDERFPMASVCKAPIAMFVASEIVEGRLASNEKITVHTRAASPGLLNNPLDRLYYLPFQTARTHTVDELIGFMMEVSDNTATDLLLKRIGGASTIKRFLSQLKIEAIFPQRTMHQILDFYYDLQPVGSSGVQRIVRIARNLRRMHPAYECRLDREKYLVESGEETCTPRAIVRLLEVLATNAKYERIYSHMERCSNQQRIAAGLKE